jgi:hypothetical protein
MNPLEFLFLIIFTIFATRIFLYFTKLSGPTIKGFRVHHYLYGIILIIISFFIKSGIILAIGLGLLIDELPLFFINDWSEKSYYSKKCLVGILIFITIIFLLLSILISK